MFNVEPRENPTPLLCLFKLSILLPQLKYNITVISLKNSLITESVTESIRLKTPAKDMNNTVLLTPTELIAQNRLQNNEQSAFI